MSEQPAGPRLDCGRTFLIGLGFLATMAAWGMYNANVPLILERSFGLSSLVIGSIMTIDNALALVFQPLFGALSDRTVTRWGRRLPYILTGLPVCAALFAFIPRMPTLPAMMSVIIAFNLIMSIWRSPNMALMPDVTPPPLRSMGSAIINLMGGIGGGLSLLVGGILINRGGAGPAFIFGSAVMAVSWLLMVCFVHEPEAVPATEAAAVEDRELIHERRDVKGINRSLLLIMFAALFWFIGYNAIGAFFTLYAVKVLAVPAGTASLMLMLFSVAVLAGAIPAGIMGTRCGRRNTIIAGLSGTVVLFACQSLFGRVNTVRPVLVLFGLCLAMVNVNALPMVTEIATSSRIGRYTGYYFFFMSLAAIVGPTVFGWIRDLTQNYGTLFAFTSAAYAIAAVCMLFVRHGEVALVEPAPEQSP